jgi:hypothetical protein
MLMRRMTTLPGFCLMVMRGASGMKRLTRGAMNVASMILNTQAPLKNHKSILSSGG